MNLLSEYPRLKKCHTDLVDCWTDTIIEIGDIVVHNEDIDNVFMTRTGTKKVWRRSSPDSGVHYVTDFLIIDEEKLFEWMTSQRKIHPDDHKNVSSV